MSHAPNIEALKDLSFKELSDHTEQVNTLFREKRDKEVEAAFKMFDEHIKEFGISKKEIADYFSLIDPSDGLHQLKKTQKPSTKNANPSQQIIKYRDPNNPENIWSGRGPKPPKWLKAYLDQGMKKEEFEV